MVYCRTGNLLIKQVSPGVSYQSGTRKTHSKFMQMNECSCQQIISVKSHIVNTAGLVGIWTLAEKQPWEVRKNKSFIDERNRRKVGFGPSSFLVCRPLGYAAYFSTDIFCGHDVFF